MSEAPYISGYCSWRLSQHRDWHVYGVMAGITVISLEEEKCVNISKCLCLCLCSCVRVLYLELCVSTLYMYLQSP